MCHTTLPRFCRRQYPLAASDANDVAAADVVNAIGCDLATYLPLAAGEWIGATYPTVTDGYPHQRLATSATVWSEALLGAAATNASFPRIAKPPYFPGVTPTRKREHAAQLDTQHTRGFPQTNLGIRHHCHDHVHDHRMKRCGRKMKLPCIRHLHGHVPSQLSRPPIQPPEHRRCHIDRGVLHS
jgi:hypothetical protein